MKIVKADKPYLQVKDYYFIPEKIIDMQLINFEENEDIQNAKNNKGQEGWAIQIEFDSSIYRHLMFKEDDRYTEKDYRHFYKSFIKYLNDEMEEE